MKIELLILTAMVLCLGQPPAAADEHQHPNSPKVSTVFHLQGLYYKSEVDYDSVRRTGHVDLVTGKPKGKDIGLIQATERGMASMATLFPDWQNNWVLHCAGRRKIGDSWLYEMAFVQQADRTPDSPSSRLNIWVLFDGTVVPTKIKKTWLFQPSRVDPLDSPAGRMELIRRTG